MLHFHLTTRQDQKEGSADVIRIIKERMCGWLIYEARYQFRLGWDYVSVTTIYGTATNKCYRPCLSIILVRPRSVLASFEALTNFYSFIDLIMCRRQPGIGEFSGHLLTHTITTNGR